MIFLDMSKAIKTVVKKKDIFTDVGSLGSRGFVDVAEETNMP
jgi:hypothetical protein